MEENTEQAVAQTPGHTHQRVWSRGERLFDFLVYGPGNFLGCFALSALLAVGQKRFFPSIHEKLEDTLRKWKVPKPITDAASPILLTSWGGTLMLPILKWAENNKVAWVQGFNRMLGDETPPEAVMDAPKQTWGSLLAGRAATIALVLPGMSLIGGMFGKAMVAAEEKTGRALTRMLDKPTHRGLAAGIEARQKQLAALAERTPAQTRELIDVTRQMEKHESITYTFGKMLAVDTFVTMAAVATLYVSSHLFARLGWNKQHREDVPSPVAEAMPVAANVPASEAAAPIAKIQTPAQDHRMVADAPPPLDRGEAR